MLLVYMLNNKTIGVLKIMLFSGQYIYKYLNSTCQELSNDMSHDSLTQLYQNS